MRTKYLPLLFILSAFCWQLTFAQTWMWANDGEGIGNNASKAITVDEQGNIYATGNIAGAASFNGTNYQGQGIFDVFIAKYNPQGSLLWVKLAGGHKNDIANAIKYKNGNLYLSGSFEDSANFESTVIRSHGGVDAFVAKYDANGNFQWAKEAGGTGTDYATAVDVDNNGNVYMGGVYEDAMVFDTTHIATTNLYNESFYAKYDNSGNLVWARSTSGDNTVHLTGLAFDHNHGIFITGFFGGNANIGGSTVTSQTPSYDIFAVKLDVDANLKWLKSAGSTYEDEANAVCADKDGNMIIAGYFAGTAHFDNDSVTYDDYNDVFVARYDSNGNNMWVRAGKGPKFDVGFAVTSDDANNVYATGIYEQNISFEGHTLTCNARQLFNVSYSPFGSFRWVNAAGGTQTACGLGIAVTPAGHVAISGYYEYSCLFDNIALTLADASNIFVAQYDQPDVSAIKETNTADLNFEIFPNPINSNELCFKSDEDLTGATIRMCDVTGNLVFKGKLGNGNSIAIPHCAPGCYLFTITQKQKSAVKRGVIIN